MSLMNAFLITGSVFFIVGAIAAFAAARIMLGLLSGKLRWGTWYR